MYKKISCLSVGLLISLNVCGAWERRDVAQPLAKKPTTVLVYIAGDNSLSPYIEINTQQLAQIGSNANVNLLAYASSKDVSGKWTRALVINKGQVVQDGPDMSKDSGKAQTAIDAVTWATQKFPSDNFVLIFWNHGSGPLNRDESAAIETLFGKPWGGVFGEKGFCYDDSTRSFFTDQDLISVLSYTVHNLRNNKPIDIVCFDACLMANIEVAYAAQPYAKYLVASEQTIPGDGYPYHTAFASAAQPKLSVAKLASSIVSAYGAFYRGPGSTPDFTLSAHDLSNIPALTVAMNSIATLLITLLNSNDHAAIKQVISASSDPSACTYFTETSYIDLGHFLSNLKTNLGKVKITNKQAVTQLNTAIASAASALQKMVIAQARGANFPKATGLTVYMERGDYVDFDYATTQWAKNTKWAHMLQAYAAS